MIERIARLIATVLVAVLIPAAAHAVITFKVTKSIEAKQSIAIIPFGGQQNDEPVPADIAAIIANDLSRTGLFELTPFADLPSRPSQHEQVNFSDWRLLGVSSLVIGNVTPLSNTEYTVEFRLYDVLRREQIIGFRLSATSPSMRRTAHQIADIIYEKLTGTRGVFDTSVVYVTETPDADANRRYALTIADADGYNERVILSSAQPVMSPSWSPDGAMLAYVSFESDNPRIFIQSLATGKREAISSFPGINGAPAFSPDGRYLAMTLSKDGNPEIYIMDLQNRRLRRLTQNSAIDTEPSWAPDGQSLAFTSDRGGKPQIYRIAIDGGPPERITFEGSYNSRPVYSPDGAKLALVHGDGGRYRIGLLDLDNGALLVLTESALDESPSFAPNGAMILYATTDDAGSALAAISSDGRMHQRLASQAGGVREPAWSPFRN